MPEGLQPSHIAGCTSHVDGIRLAKVMKMTGTARRRWFGGIVLGLAAAMLILGETVLNTRLNRGTFVIYWTTCFLLTMAAIIVAFIDIRAVQQKVGREQRDLLEGTLSQIEKEARGRKRR